MKPAWSIIVFTVLSGFGLGLAFALALGADILELTPATIWVMSGASALLTAAGLCSSVLHLANPRNAWRALFRVRSSWLSREGVLALLFFPALALWSWSPSPALSAALMAISAATVFCTAMIYASLRPIRLWRHWLTPANYLLLSAYSGCLLFALGVGAARGEIPGELCAILLGLIALSGLGKVFHFIRAESEGALTAGAATGLGAARVRLLESGHGGRNFLTREFVFTPERKRIATTRRLAGCLGFGIPPALALTVLALPQAHPLLWLALASALGGLLAERWLFFAEARHAVRLYHGDSRA